MLFFVQGAHENPKFVEAANTANEVGSSADANTQILFQTMSQFNSDVDIYNCLCDARKLPPEGDHREEDAVLDCIIVVALRHPHA